MAEELIDALRSMGAHPIAELRLIPSGGGRYEVMVDGELIFSKAASGRHTSSEEILALIRQRSGGAP